MKVVTTPDSLVVNKQEPDEFQEEDPDFSRRACPNPHRDRRMYTTLNHGRHPRGEYCPADP